MFLTTNLAAVAGGVATMFLTYVKYGKPSLSLTLNGVLAGLVGITAGCDLVSPMGAVVIGFVCGIVRYRIHRPQTSYRRSCRRLQRAWCVWYSRYADDRPALNLQWCFLRTRLGLLRS